MTYLELEEYLIANNFANVAQIIINLKRYDNLLSDANKVMNLTAVKDEDTVEKHFYDSLLLSELYKFNDQKLLDVGSGAGLPGLVLAIVFSKLQVTLLEPTGKRCLFLNRVISDLNLTNVKVVNLRAEQYINQSREAFDLVTARAVASLPILLELTVPFLKVKGQFLAMKGPSVDEELTAAHCALKILNTQVSNIKKHILPSESSERINVALEKQKLTNHLYPRNYSQIKKRPL